MPWTNSRKSVNRTSEARRKSITRTMRAANNGTGAMVAFFLAPEDAEAIALPADALPDGGELEPAERMHVTLAYLGKADELDIDRDALLAQLQSYATEAGPIAARVSGIGRFNAPDGEPTPVYASIDSVDLAGWRALLLSAIEAIEITVPTEHGFTPHVTLAYIPPDAPMPNYLPPARELSFDALALAWAGDVEIISLTEARMRKRKRISGKQLIAGIRDLLAQATIGRPPAPVMGNFVTNPASVNSTSTFVLPAPAGNGHARDAKRSLPMGAIFEQAMMAAYVSYPDAFVTDLYADDDGSLFLLLAQDGKPYRCPISIDGETVTLGEWKPVSVDFVEAPAPVESEAEPDGARARTTIIRQADGRVRWLSQSCTAVLNRVGEIDGTELFDSFIAHAEATGEYPIRQFYHAGEAFKTGQADFLARDGFVYLTSGLFDDSDIARAEIEARESDPEYWGESIGYDATEPPVLIDVGDGIRLPLYRAGIHREISTLPEHEAAALFTRTTQEVKRMALNDRQMQALILMFGGDEEKARKWLAENPDATNRAIAAANMVARAGAAAPAIPAPAAPPVATLTPVAPIAPAPIATIDEPDPARAKEDDEDDEEDDDLLDDDEEDEDDEKRTAESDEIELDEQAISAIAEHILESPDMLAIRTSLESLTASVETLSRQIADQATRAEGTATDLDGRLAELEGDDQERQRAWQEDQPGRRRFLATYRARAHVEPAGPEAAESMAQTAGSTLDSLPI